MQTSVFQSSRSFLNAPTHIAPLAVLRIVFGSLMLVSTLRFMLKGWVTAFYVEPRFHFTFYGFGWVKPLGTAGMYGLFGLLIISALFIILGLFYRAAILAFFLGFTYVELIDKTTYLNHYYLVSVLAFLLVLVPAHRYFSLDVVRRPQLTVSRVPRWTIGIMQAQIVLVYFLAGLAKLNSDWLLEAMPLRIWLPANSHLPIVGGLLTQLWVAYAFSWLGALFDLAIGFLLLCNKTRTPAYVLVIVFHLVTGWFFKIGMFPYIMMGVTLIFFPANTHLRILAGLKRLLPESMAARMPTGPDRTYPVGPFGQTVLTVVLLAHFTLQIVLPFRFLLYPGNLYWTEEGYRFSWRVMLMEKGGTAFFHVKDPQTGRTAEIINTRYLTELQEKMMATQPDMILQYAQFLAQDYQKRGIENPVVTAESYVTLNGSGSRLYIDSTVNLATEQESFGPKRWILPFQKKDQ